MIRAITTFLLLLLPSYAEAAFTDFEDLTLNEMFSVGETINSNGVAFDVIDFVEAGAMVLVSGSGGVNGSARQLGLGGLGLTFQLPASTTQLSLLYDTNLDSSGIEINGIATPLSDTFNDLNGALIAGVSITVNVLPSTFEAQGELILNGPINSFLIGGQELAIDDVTILVPVPATATLLIAAGMTLFTTRRIRRS